MFSINNKVSVLGYSGLWRIHHILINVKSGEIEKLRVFNTNDTYQMIVEVGDCKIAD